MIDLKLDSLTTSCEDFHTEIVQCINDLERLDPNAESFSSSVGNVFRTVVDVFGRILNSLKTEAFKFGKAVKRSEIKAYSEAHIATISALEKLTYDKLMTQKVDVPSGLNTSFVTACVTIDKEQRTLALTTIASSMAAACKEYYIKLSRKTLGADGYFMDKTMSITPVVKHANDQFKDVAHCFAGKNSDVKNTPFGSAYASMEDFRAVRKHLLDMERYLTTAPSLTATMEETNDYLINICNLLDDPNTTVSKDTVVRIAEITRMMAGAYEMYGVACTYQSMLEHNHILNLENLYKAAFTSK